jgi:hypothetical protein
MDSASSFKGCHLQLTLSEVEPTHFLTADG